MTIPLEKLKPKMKATIRKHWSPFLDTECHGVAFPDSVSTLVATSKFSDFQKLKDNFEKSVGLGRVKQENSDFCA